MLKKSNIAFSIALLFLISCDKKRVFDKYTSITDATWKSEQKIAFNFTVNDTISKRNLFINLRNNNDYPFSNLYMITNLSFPDGTQVTDTLEYEMADPSGKFLGKGLTSIKENKLYYKENIDFPLKGEYTFSVRQAMRKNGEVEGIKVLKGITEIGFRIEKIK